MKHKLVEIFPKISETKGTGVVKVEGALSLNNLMGCDNLAAVF